MTLQEPLEIRKKKIEPFLFKISHWIYIQSILATTLYMHIIANSVNMYLVFYSFTRILVFYILHAR